MPSLKLKNYALLIMSLIFYAWGEPFWILLMIFTGFQNYFCGLMIGKSDTKSRKKLWLVISIAINLGLLGLFKYTGFIIDNINLIPGVHLPGWKIGLPIGISFYTFQAMSYTIDVYRGETPVQRSYAYFLLYVTLFPQLIAGPIVRYVDVANEITNRRVTPAGFSKGITRFLTGMAKKLLLANYCGEAVDRLLGRGGDTSVLGGWLGLVLFAFQIYFDFSGYSDMAIGLGKMIGFKFKENFNYPYICSSITDFWRRWHISLSTFFRDYLYIPLGGNRKRPVFNLLIVWFLTGLWHGASWNFILWGLYFAVFLILEKYVFASVIKKLPGILKHTYSLFIVLMGWALFYFENLSEFGSFLKRIYGLGGNSLTSVYSLSILSNYSLLILVCILASTPIGKLFRGLNIHLVRSGGKLMHIGMSMRLIYNCAVLAICTVVMVTNTYNPFLYFRF
jgi:alginate O-acetyltransferase complex protein AlgI